MAVNDALLDASISHQVGLQRLSMATTRKIVALLNRVGDDLARQIRGLDPTAVTGEWSRRRLDKLLDAVRTVSTEAYRVVKRELGSELKELATYEADFQKRMLQGNIPVALDIVTPTPAQLTAAVNSRPFQGKMLRDVVDGLDANTARRVREAIRMGIAEGETIDQIVRRVRGTRAAQFRDGIMEVSRREAEAVVRTAVNHTANTARAEVYKANPDVVKSVRWVATLDDRTTMICASRDGEIYPVDSGPRPPAHFRCRSTTTPVTKSWREMGIDIDEMPASTRASMNGQVPGDMTYNEWLRKQPAEMQDEVLGGAKGKLFRDGGLNVDRFVDRKGREWTLDELRRRESEAFAKAGL